MKKLLKWIQEKYLIDSIILKGASVKTGNIPEPMLIGYMIEYCNEYNISFNIIDNSDVGQIFTYLKKRVGSKK